LSAGTADLVQRFAQAMLEKLAKAEDKYGYGIGWMDDYWEDDCRHKFIEHAAKGDPTDVANYCAFMWHHGWSTAALPAVGDVVDEGQILAARDAGVKAAADWLMS